MNDLNILLTSAGSPAFPGAFRSLKMNGERNIKIIATDMKDDCHGKHLADGFYKVPRGDKREYPNAIRKIVVKEKIDVIIPLSTKENLSLSKEGIAMGIPILTSEHRAIKDVIDKDWLYSQLFKMHSKCIPYRRLLSIDHIDGVAEDLGYPEKVLCVKPCKGEGSVGFIIIDAKADTNKQYFSQKHITRMKLEQYKMLFNVNGDFKPLVMMEYIEGKEYSIDLLMSKGKVITGGVRLRQHVVNGISNMGVIVDRPDIFKLASKMVEKFGLNYNVGVQIIESEDGTLYPLEVNARLHGTAILCTAAGINLLYLGLKLLLKESFRIPAMMNGVKMYRAWNELYDYPEDKKLPLRPNVCIDFDGVIAGNPAIWNGQEDFGKNIVRGFVEKFAQKFTIIIYTSRKDLNAVKAYLKSNQIPFDRVMSKPDAVAYIDDRAIQFKGNWPDTLTQLNKLKRQYDDYFGKK
ncbi:MAG: ATP-grasp domain-containing protein [bacterium]|nr:ATP-grasp domain-containing protein [bacterium]